MPLRAGRFRFGFRFFRYFKKFPGDLLKIDGALITNVLDDPTDQRLVRSMVEIAHGLGKEVIAKHVENQNVLDHLLEVGVDYVQGYHIGAPRPHLVDAEAP